MRGTENEVYDKTLEYNEEIAPLVDKLIQACNINRIPMFLCMAPKNTKEETTYETKVLSPAQFSTKLRKNYFSDFINVVNGLSTTYYQAPEDKGSNEEYEELVELMKEGQPNIGKELPVQDDEKGDEG